MVQATVTDSGAGGATAQASQNVTVSPDLTAMLTGPGAPTAGQSATYTAGAAGGYTTGVGYTFAWTIDGQAAGSTSPISPKLSVGTHTIQVVVTDDAAPAHTMTRSIWVTAVPPCPSTVTFQLTQITTTGCLIPTGNGTYATADAIKLNGLQISAPPVRQAITITEPTNAHPGGQVSATTATISADGFEVYRGPIAWNLPADNSLHWATVTSLTVPAGQAVGGLSVVGSTALRIGYTPGLYYAVFPIEVQLPAPFASGPTGNIPVTGQAWISVDARGAYLPGLTVRVANAYLGDLQVRSACFTYMPAGAGSVESPCPPPALDGSPFSTCTQPSTGSSSETWSGGADVVLPTPIGTTIGLFGTIQGGSLTSLGGVADNLGSSVPINADVFLTRVGLGLRLKPPPLQLKGEADVSALGASSPFVLTISGSMDFVDSRPWSLTVAGPIHVLGFKVGTGSLTMTPQGGEARVGKLGKGLSWTGATALSLHTDFSPENGVTIFGGMAGWIQVPYEFSLGGKISLCITGTSSSPNGENLCKPMPMTGVISRAGVAGCGTDGSYGYSDAWGSWHTDPLQVGFTYHWGGRVWYRDSCDLGDYSDPASGAAGGAFTVPRGAQALAVRIRGRGAAPLVTVTGPSGFSISSPPTGAGASLAGPDELVQNPSDDDASLLLLKPKAGRWHVTTHAGSVPLTTIATASPQPPAAAKGAAQTLTGGHIDLRLSYWLAPAETMVLFVRGPDGSVQPLGRATGRPCPQPSRARGGRRPLCEALQFTPILGPAGVRTILGLVSRHGVPDTSLTIAHFKVAPPPVPHAPLVRITRARGGVKVAWTPVHDAARYAVAVQVSDGRDLSPATKERSAFVPQVGLALVVRATVWAISPDDIVGHPGRATLKAGKKHS